MTEKSAKIIKIVVGVAATGLVIGLGVKYFIDQQLKKLLNYCYNLKDGRLNAFTKNNLSLSLVITVGNKSDIDFTIEGYTFDVLLNGQKVGQIQAVVNQKIKAGYVADIPVNISVNPEAIYKGSITNLTSILTISSSVNFGIKGFISAQAYNFRVRNLSIDITTNLAQLTSGGSSASPQRCVTDANGKLV